jgi:DNA invertase Pin-like site-specific DNA recombinase
MQAVIYTRVSSDQNQGRSVQDQERECRQQCERNGWPVRKVFCNNNIGASRHSRRLRPSWERLKAELRPGDILVTWESSRSTRDLAEHLTLRTRCAELGVPLSYSGRILDMSEAEDRFVFSLDSLLDEREAEKIRTRVLRGKRASANKGRPFGLAPWGYRRTGQAEWEVDPVEGPRVREAVERMLAGESQRSILLWLRSTESDEARERTRGKAPATGPDLRRALCNPTIASLRVHQGKVIGPGTWEPIITEEQHKRLLVTTKRKIRESGHTSRPGPEPRHLLSHIAVCGKCDKGLEWVARKGRAESYRCPSGHVWRNAVLLDGQVLAELVKCFAQEPPPADDEAAQAARDEIAEIEADLQEWIAKAQRREVSAASFAQIEPSLRARIAELEPLTVEAAPNPYAHVRISTSAFMAASVAERREMVRSRLSVTANPVPPGRRAATAEDVVIVPLHPYRISPSD